MNRRFLAVIMIALIVLPLAFLGCKGKVETPIEEPTLDTSDIISPLPPESMTSAQEAAQNVVIEPSQTVAMEPIPATAAFPETAQMAATAVAKVSQDRNKEIQIALKNAGFYTSSIDGKIGPMTKKSIMEFQKANGLKVDGKVGPKTWAVLEKYLLKQ
ncbi:MAG: peptidoglycan-binding protein [Candidatus Omnitrophica bacterium]|nr:peptidoglycan-binding protein [Candidatus Omnitrophota bacterium]